MTTPLIQETPTGLYCERADFYIDPCRRVQHAVITHAHADHARPGSRKYLAAKEGRRVLRSRLGPSAEIEAILYGETKSINGVSVSFHPAGHILGSAQVRIEYRGEVWVVSGDYKTEPDATCAAFEPVRCHTFVTESTFGLPEYHWPNQRDIFVDINRWWIQCRNEGKVAILLAYALGKAQRVIAGVDSAIGPIYCHPSVQVMNDEYRASGIDLPKTWLPSQAPARKGWGGVLIVAPPSHEHSVWLARFGRSSIALASGWMLTRQTRKSQSVETGFPLSDHADWPGLLHAIEETRAEQILVMHGQTESLAAWLNENGKKARSVMTEAGLASAIDTKSPDRV